MDENDNPVVIEETTMLGTSCGELVLPEVSCPVVDTEDGELRGHGECINMCPN